MSNKTRRRKPAAPPAGGVDAPVKERANPTPSADMEAALGRPQLSAYPTWTEFQQALSEWEASRR